LTSVLYAIRPNRDYFNVSPAGRVSVAEDGLTTFSQATNSQATTLGESVMNETSGRDRFLILRDDQKARTTEALVQLSSQPPESR
jgi:hypothetical protein